MGTSFIQSYYGKPPVWYSGSNYLHLVPSPGTVTVFDNASAIEPTDNSPFVSVEDYSNSISISDYTSNISF
jgi:hypothetical protein